jgi:hypothetical protein
MRKQIELWEKVQNLSEKDKGALLQFIFGWCEASGNLVFFKALRHGLATHKPKTEDEK